MALEQGELGKRPLRPEPAKKHDDDNNNNRILNGAEKVDRTKFFLPYVVEQGKDIFGSMVSSNEGPAANKRPRPFRMTKQNRVFIPRSSLNAPPNYNHNQPSDFDLPLALAGPTR